MSEHDFRALCIPHRDNLVAFAQRLTGRRDLAEDLVQDALVSALRRWDDFKPVGDPSACARAWMYANVRNKFVTDWRRARRRRRWLEDQRGDVLAGVYGEADEATLSSRDAPTDEPEMAEEVGRALDDLDPNGREVVERIDIRGQQYGQVAADLGVPIGTVMSRLHRARRRLAVSLAKYARREYRITLNRDDRAIARRAS